jgi:hypothetical protein
VGLQASSDTAKIFLRGHFYSKACFFHAIPEGMILPLNQEQGGNGENAKSYKDFEGNWVHGRGGREGKGLAFLATVDCANEENERDCESRRVRGEGCNEHYIENDHEDTHHSM